MQTHCGLRANPQAVVGGTSLPSAPLSRCHSSLSPRAAHVRPPPSPTPLLHRCCTARRTASRRPRRRERCWPPPWAARTASSESSAERERGTGWTGGNGAGELKQEGQEVRKGFPAFRPIRAICEIRSQKIPALSEPPSAVEQAAWSAANGRGYTECLSSGEAVKIYVGKYVRCSRGRPPSARRKLRPPIQPHSLSLRLSNPSAPSAKSAVKHPGNSEPPSAVEHAVWSTTRGRGHTKAIPECTPFVFVRVHSWFSPPVRHLPDSIFRAFRAFRGSPASPGVHEFPRVHSPG